MRKFLFLFLLAASFFACKTKAKMVETKPTTPAPTATVTAAKADKPETPKPPKIKPYKDIITKEAVSDSGFFVVHKVDGVSYFELPKTVLNKEILITSRISGFVKNLNFGGAGVESRPQRVIRWQRNDDQIFLRYVSYNSVANENDPIYQSVKNNNFEPIIMAFDIKAFSKDSSAYVIDVTPLFTTDVELIGALDPSQVKQFGTRGVDSKRSFISGIKSFPQNVEVRHVLTYNGSSLPDNQIAGAMSIEMNQSFILLPEVPMTPRNFDERVGYFSVGHTNYSLDEQRAATERFITRWRLEPKDEDREKYFKGELVVPKKQIVYYIDPATPIKWRKYLKQGIEDWQVAFEAAGFKQAIIAKDAPTKEEDPDWSPEDVRYSVIRYVSTDIQNAQGPHVHDPRTGEILESDIIWYHNVMNLLRNWFFIQTAAINPAARKVKFSDEVMGRCIRFVSAHEVGHTLGLPHNMGSSSAYPVDSLRSPSFTKKMGTAPSIMDYARFNYVAQPNDGDVALMPEIGIYDKWSIMYGYKLLPEVKSADDEKMILNGWVKERANEKLYRFGRQRGMPTDPSAQTEDLGDNSMKASALGIENLKKIVPNLITWTAEEGEDYSQLKELYGQAIGQYSRYLGHVTANIGGIYENFKTADQKEAVYEHVEKDRQKAAVDFLVKQLYNTPTWIINEAIISRTEESAVGERIRSLQDQSLASIMNSDRLKRIIENSTLNGNKAYNLLELFDDLSDGIFTEMSNNASIDIYRRNLQRTFIEGLQRVLEVETNAYEHTDMKAIARGKLIDLQRMIGSYKNTDRLSLLHRQDLLQRIKLILEGKEK